MNRLILRCLGVSLWMLEILMQWVLTPVAVKESQVEAALRMSRDLRGEINMEMKVEPIRDTAQDSSGS